jgi:hypothetical protein
MAQERLCYQKKHHKEGDNEETTSSSKKRKLSEKDFQRFIPH